MLLVFFSFIVMSATLRYFYLHRSPPPSPYKWNPRPPSTGTPTSLSLEELSALFLSSNNNRSPYLGNCRHPSNTHNHHHMPLIFTITHHNRTLDHSPCCSTTKTAPKHKLNPYPTITLNHRNHHPSHPQPSLTSFLCGLPTTSSNLHNKIPIANSPNTITHCCRSSRTIAPPPPRDTTPNQHPTPINHC